MAEIRPAETRAKVKAGTYEEAYFYRVDALSTRSGYVDTVNTARACARPKFMG